MTRLRAKQTVRPLSKGRTIQRAKRLEEPEGQVEVESKATQTDAQFYTLADLPDSPYEESESGHSFLDDVNISPSSEDGFWSDKAYSHLTDQCERAQPLSHQPARIDRQF